MHTGGLPFNGDTIKTESLGGSETAAYYMALELTKLGHKVIIFTNSQETGTFDGVKYEWVGDVTEKHPLGERFTFYASNTPHDVCIIQRHLQAFVNKIASKMNFWWVHDLALVRSKSHVSGMIWNIDKILCVSEWHKNQICETWGIERDTVYAIHNGIDLSLFEGEIGFQLGKDVATGKEYEKGIRVTLPIPEGQKSLIYSSRPERGLINLVAPDGIMERLIKECPEAHLYVCGYENTTDQMRPYYEYLWKRCDELPNVTRLGALTKKQLADAMRQCDALVYPTEFEEVSCITAMEAMAAGLPFISSELAALPETCKDSGSYLIPMKDGKADVESFVSLVKNYDTAVTSYQPSVSNLNAFDLQLKASKKYAWSNAALMLLNAVNEIFTDTQKNTASLANHFMRHSDIVAFGDVLSGINDLKGIAGELAKEYDKCYGFYRDNTYAEHYKNYYEYEKGRGVEYGPEDVSNTSRFMAIANMVGLLPVGSIVLDYGCAHGHYTMGLAQRYPDLTFIGADLSQSNIESARKWAEQAGQLNVSFIKVDGYEDIQTQTAGATFQFILAAEIIEHVGNPQEYIDGLCKLLTDDGKMAITVPYGAWEAMGYREHYPWRAHLHHFERQDLHEMLGHHPGFNIAAAPSGMSSFSSVVGSYIVSFNKPVESSKQIDYTRKIKQTVPDETISCCMIVKDGAKDIQRCLDSVLPNVQEVIISVDTSTKDDTLMIAHRIAKENPLVAFTIYNLDSAIELGFAEMRNNTLKHATGDWILWIDSDEVLVNGLQLSYYTRNNQYNGYAVRQHHHSLSPMAIIKIDLPCRLFRNFKGIKFFGAVHEHPERVLNEGLGPVMLLNGIEIAHYGYTTELVRRKRFGRNIDLLERDRKELPDRLLGKFLWVRDLAQMCQYDQEAGKGDIAEFRARAEEGIKLWEDLLNSGNTRITLDSLPYYSQLVSYSGETGFEFGFKIDASKLNGGLHLKEAQEITGLFKSKEHAFKLMNAFAEDKIAGFDSRYF